MTNIFETTDFRIFLRGWLKKQPKAGRGLLGQWSEKLGVHPTQMSQILAGKKEMSLETAEELARLLQLSESETDYFLLLVQESRAGSEALRKLWKKKILEAQKRSQVLAERLQKTTQLSETARAEFYSSWLYSGIRNLSALPEMRSADQISEHLRIPRSLVRKVLDFLLENGLCVMTEKGLDVGPQRTHLAASSPLANKHHQNWRLQAIQEMPLAEDANLFFTFPMSLSEKDATRIRALLPKWIEEVHGIVGPSPSETVRCLNIDFFKY